MRPDLHPRSRDRRNRTGQHRRRPHDVLVLLPRRRPHPLFIHPPLQPRLSGPTRLLPGLRVGRVPELRRLRSRRRRLEPSPAHQLVRLRRRSDLLTHRAPHRIHVHARRGSRPVLDAPRRLRRAAPHRPAGLRRRRLLQPRRHEDRVARALPRDRAGTRGLPVAARRRPHPPIRPRHLRGRCRRIEPAPDHRQRGGELRSILAPLRRADHLLVEHGRPSGA